MRKTSPRELQQQTLKNSTSNNLDTVTMNFVLTEMNWKATAQHI